jgi:CNP1-like family
VRRLPLAACVLAAACGTVEEKSDWERSHATQLPPAEAGVAPPAYPREQDLIEFFVAATSEFRFFIDASSLSVEKGLVRYVLVARSPAGAENVSYEGMRCESAEVRIYALGRNGVWTGTPGPWRAIEPRSVQRWHNALYREYFCPQREPVANARRAVDALRSGGASLTGTTMEDIPRGGGAR